ncbi:LysR family transcriptional regulator [Bordetella genomosp. 10]|nr:LysR family transcriptional regulator [Bordetella genomosp. 10]
MEQALLSHTAEVGASTDQRPLNLRHIEIFRAIMLSGSICSAGKILHVSQPALSRTLALAESRLGYPLFERTKRRLVPTPEARRLYAEIEDVYERMRGINSLAANLAQGSMAVLKIATSSCFEQTLLPLALTSLQSHVRNLRALTRTFKAAEVAHELLSGNVDLGISLTPIEHPRLATQQVGEDKVVCVMPRTSPLRYKAVIRAEDFLSHPWIGYPPQAPLGKTLRRFLGSHADAVCAIEADTPVAASAYAKNGLGSAIVNAASLPPEIRERTIIRPLDEDPRIGIWASHSNLTPPSVACQKLIAAIRCLAKEQLQKDVAARVPDEA